MKVKHFFFLFIVLFFILGCAHPPEEEMQNAREAVFRAENDANAVQYAGQTLSRARDAIRSMDAEAESKRFDSAKTFAAEAIAAAERAVAEGRTGADRTRTESDMARAEADSLVSGLRAEIEQTSSNIASAQYARVALDYDSLDRSIINAHNTTDRAEADQAAGRYQQAADNARAVRLDLANINQMIANASVIRKK